MGLEEARKALNGVQVASTRASNHKMLSGALHQIKAAVDAAMAMALEAEDAWINGTEEERKELGKLLNQAFGVISLALGKMRMLIFEHVEEAE